MPPWKADPANGPFVGQHPLTDAEIATDRPMGRQGRAEGDRARLPAPPSLDRRLAARDSRIWSSRCRSRTRCRPKAPTCSASSCCRFRRRRTRYVRGLEFRPGNPQVVHHANIRIDTDAGVAAARRAGSGARLRRADRARRPIYPDGHFLGWTPGQVAPLLPNDLAWRSIAGTDLVVELHMQPSGKPERSQPSIGLYFSDAAPTRTPAMLRLGRQNIDIPAGEPRYTITDSYVLPVDVEVQARPAARALPRARGPRRGDAARRHDAAADHIKDWDFRWQHVYRFVTPLRAAEGHDAVDAVHLRQLRGEPAQSAAAAEARALGAAIVGRDGRPLDPGADARRRRSGAPEPRVPAEGGRRGRRRLRDRDREASGGRRRCTTTSRCCISSSGAPTRRRALRDARWS